MKTLSHFSGQISYYAFFQFEFLTEKKKITHQQVTVLFAKQHFTCDSFSQNSLDNFPYAEFNEI